MKHPIKSYARALAEVAAGKHSPSEEAKIATNFLELVRRNGDASRLPKIVEEAGKMLREKEGLRKVSFESARPLAGSAQKHLHAFLKDKDIVEERVNPELVAGVRVTVNDERQFDGSLARKLQQMFAK